MEKFGIRLLRGSAIFIQYLVLMKLFIRHVFKQFALFLLSYFCVRVFYLCPSDLIYTCCN